MGKPPSLYSFSSSEDLAKALRSFVLSAQNSAFERGKTFRVAVSGGSLPKVLAQALLAPNNSTGEDAPRFSQWEIFYADERCVALDHEDSNHKAVKEALLDKIPASEGKPTVYTIDTSVLDDAQAVADAYEKDLLASFAAKDSVKYPVFDLILLGCGPDGHTCSLFPNHPLLRETDGWIFSISDSPKPPPKRITLSLPVVTAAMKIGFVATGAGKKEVMHKIFDTEEGHALPCGLVNDAAADKVTWFTDDAATKEVMFPKRGNL